MVVDRHIVFICLVSQRGGTSASEITAFEITIELLRYLFLLLYTHDFQSANNSLRAVLSDNYSNVRADICIRL